MMVDVALVFATIYIAYLIGLYVGHRTERNIYRDVYEPPSHVQIRRPIYDWERDDT